MTHQLDVAFRRELSARWCALAERRLEYLTDLFESGRWSRYYTERSLLENIREAKNAVKIWQALSRGEALVREIEVGAVVEKKEPMKVGRQTLAAADLAELPMQPFELAPSIDVSLAEADIFLPEDVVMPEPEPIVSRVDMAALEQALGGGSPDRSAPPRIGLDTIERRYPALRHSL